MWTFLYYFIPCYTGGFKATLRAIINDAPKHPSPNSGIPEAAVAGSLGVQLGGTNYYQGELSREPLWARRFFNWQAVI
nr:cobalamin biosynthesis protein [Desulforamulus aquiferis]